MAYSNLSNQGLANMYPTPDFHKHLISTIVAERHKNLIAENMYKLKSIIRMETETLVRMMHDRERLLCNLVDQYEGILSQNCCACSCHPTMTDMDNPPQKQRLEYQSPFNEMKKLILEYGTLKLINKANASAEDLTPNESQKAQWKVNVSNTMRCFVHPRVETTQKTNEPIESEDSFEVLDSAEVEECFCKLTNPDGILFHAPSCHLPPLDLRLSEPKPISKMSRPSPDYFNKIMNYLGNCDPAKEAASFEAVKKWLESKGCVVSEDPSAQLKKQLSRFPFPEFGYVQDGVRRDFSREKEPEPLEVQSPASPDPTPETPHLFPPPPFDQPEVTSGRSLSQEVLDSFKNLLSTTSVGSEDNRGVASGSVASSEVSTKDVASVSEEVFSAGVATPSDQVKASMESYLGLEQNEKWLR